MFTFLDKKGRDIKVKNCYNRFINKGNTKKRYISQSQVVTLHSLQGKSCDIFVSNDQYFAKFA